MRNFINNYVVSNPPARQIQSVDIRWGYDCEQLETFIPSVEYYWLISNEDYIKSIEIQRTGEEGKFFGFGIAHTLKLVLIDPDKELFIPDPEEETFFYFVHMYKDYDVSRAFPAFKITGVERNEITGEITITGHDMVYDLGSYTVQDVANKTIEFIVDGEKQYYTFDLTNEYARAPSEIMFWLDTWMEQNANWSNTEAGWSFEEPAGGFYYWGLLEDLDLNYIRNDEHIGFNATDTLRQVFNACAEAVGAVYFMDAGYSGLEDPEDNNIIKSVRNYNHLRVETPTIAAEDELGVRTIAIGKDEYFSLTVGAPKTLKAICHTTELGDNLIAESATVEAGITQYLRENALLNTNPEAADRLNELLPYYEGQVLTPFKLEWRGTLEPLWERVSAESETASDLFCTDDTLLRRYLITTKDDTVIETYAFNETITYDGGLRVVTELTMDINESETDANSTSLGEVLKQTYARVDKANQKIDLVISDLTDTGTNYSSIRMELDKISAAVSQTEEALINHADSTNETIAQLTSKVETALTPEDLTIEIQKELAGAGIDKITTSTGYKFDDEGLSISKSDSEMSTLITEDGMKVYKNEEIMLTADNQGVIARNLHAETYLIIGNNSRFEDYTNTSGAERTGCFWIGG